MRASAEDRAFVLAEAPATAIADRTLLQKSLAVFALVIAGFVLAHPIGIEPGVTALSGGLLLLLLDCLGRTTDEQSAHVERILGEVDWVTIFFFIGLFVMVAAIERSGLLASLAHVLVAGAGGRHTLLLMAVLWGSAGLSAVFDNIPFVATMIPIVKQIGPSFGGPEGLQPLWWALALGACLGGNGTLIGASANLAAAGLAEQAGHPIHFWSYLRMGLPVTLLSIAIAALYVWLRYA
jgi:Na+/H+ antiporter NhaD/arsenite permease-like protein